MLCFFLWKSQFQKLPNQLPRWEEGTTDGLTKHPELCRRISHGPSGRFHLAGHTRRSERGCGKANSKELLSPEAAIEIYMLSNVQEF